MFNKILTTFLIGGAVTTAMAGDGDWDMSVGATFRKFKSTEFKSFATEEQYFNGTYDGANATVKDTAKQVSPAEAPLAGNHIVSLHSVSFGSSTDDLENSTGLVLQWTRDIQTSTMNKVGGLDWKFDLSLVWVGVDQGKAGLSETGGDTFLTNKTPGDFAGETPQPVVEGDYPLADVVASSARFDLDIDAFTFGAGIASRFEMGPLDLKIGMGPSLTLVNYNVSYEGYAGFINDQDVVVDESDDDIVARWGLYGTLGLIYDFSENWGMEVGLRYDYIPDNVNTNVVNMDLSGMSTEVKLVYSF